MYAEVSEGGLEHTFTGDFPDGGNHEVRVAGHAPHLSTRLLPDGVRLVPADLNPHKRRDAAVRRLAGPLP